MATRVKDPYAVEPRKLPSGRWKGRVVRYDPKDGKRIEMNWTFDTKKAAKNWAETKGAKYRENPIRKPPSDVTFAEFFAQWLVGTATVNAHPMTEHLTRTVKGCTSWNRPRNPTGFVRPQPDTKTKSWQGIVKYPDPDRPGQWKTRSKTFDRKAEAQKWVDETLAEHRQNATYKPPSEETVQEFLTRWLNESVRGRRRTTTVERYRVDIDHIICYLGPLSLAQLTPRHIQELYGRLATDDGLSPSSIKHVHVVLRAALTDALTWDLLVKDPLRGVTPPQPQPKELVVPSVDEARAFLRAAESHRLWAFLALSGARKGEALGLQRSDIDWTARTVTIQRTVAGYASKRTVNPPKSRAGRRVIALSEFLLETLRRHLHQQKLERLAAGSRWEEGPWVFTTRHGRWLAPAHVHEQFKRLLTKAGLAPTMRIHDLRHALASYWLANGVPVKVVSERLGHANIAITLQVYGHLLPNMQAEAADKMDAWLMDGVTTSGENRDNGR